MARPIQYLVKQGQDAPVWPSTPPLLALGDMIPATPAQVEAWHNPKPRVEDDFEDEVETAPVKTPVVDYLAITDKAELAAEAKRLGVKIPQGATLVATQALLVAASNGIG